MEKLLSDGYEIVPRDPLPKMIRETTATISMVKKVFGEKMKWQLIVSNPSVPRMYGLPKIHKTGNLMRPIVSNIGAPFYKLAKWLVKEFKSLKQPIGLYVKNSFEFSTKIREIDIEENEEMVSFDVTALFPNIPVKAALDEMNRWICTNNTSDEIRNVYMKVASLCMNLNYFQFRNKFYKLSHGTSMGNPLSPIIADCYMSSFEMKLKNDGTIPRIWWRYVDDVFAVVNKNNVNDVLTKINEQAPTIKFTIERENENGKLAFLDLELLKINNKIDISVYRKPTNTKRYITSDSHCPIQQKMAAFHSLVYRLCNLPLSPQNFINELQYIKSVAEINGYDPTNIDFLVNKHSRNIRLNNLTTLFSQNKKLKNSEINRVKMCYAPGLSNKLCKVFKKHSMDLVYVNKCKLKLCFKSTKDEIPSLNKSGIYEITCKNCPQKYIGQSKRSVSVRYKEHFSHIKYNRPSKSSLAKHILETDHDVDASCLKLIKCVNNVRNLDALESYYIYINKDIAMNSDTGNIDSSFLFKLL